MSIEFPDVVLLTATVVAPSDARNLARRSTELRLQDYLRAFDFYLAELAGGAFGALVLCENSGFDLEPFSAKVRRAGLQDRVELIGFFGLDHPASYGRGYGEFKLVDHAMQHSALIARLGPQVQVWKVTGRYIVRNIAQLVTSQPRHADLYCHCRNLPRVWLDMYLMRWNLRAYTALIRGVYLSLQQDATPTSAEQRFRALLDRPHAALRVVRRFRHVPRIDGIRGFDNRSYGAMRVSYVARAMAHRLAPWIWV
jgi:hypothetical protein